MLGKVCGITHEADLQCALKAGADFLGFLCHPTSPRHCPDPALPMQAGDKGVLVIPAATLEHLLAALDRSPCPWVQPYLDPAWRAAGLATLRAQGRRIILPWPDRADNLDLSADLYLWECDPAQTGLLGGSGQSHAMRYPPPGPYLLAGGLDGDTLPMRVKSLPESSKKNLRGFDAASRLEASPGRKDPTRVEAFLAALRQIT